MTHKITDDEIIQLLKDGVSNAEIARNNGMDIRTFYRRKAKLIKKGWSPEHDMTHAVPDGFAVKGTSTLYGDDGNLKIQWVKTSIDAERQAELMQAAIAAMCEEIPPCKTTPIVAKHTNEKLVNAYIITDFHLGMMAWHEETGEDWDMDIAEDLLYAWFKTAIDQSPAAKVGIFVQLADFLHWDGMDAVTPQHKNILDADTRFQKLVRVAIRAIRRIIDSLLEKHDEVVLIQPGGNHDPASTVWLREMFFAMYEGNDRVIVDRNADLYCCYEHGKTALFFHHGHKRSVANIDTVFVAKYREIYGRTTAHYAHMGHLHHVDVKETNLMIIEQHRTLAAHDAYASQGGWMSGRDAKCITYHSEFGEVSRLTISPDMLK